MALFLRRAAIAATLALPLAAVVQSAAIGSTDAPAAGYAPGSYYVPSSAQTVPGQSPLYIAICDGNSANRDRATNVNGQDITAYTQDAANPDSSALFEDAQVVGLKDSKAFRLTCADTNLPAHNY